MNIDEIVQQILSDLKSEAENPETPLRTAPLPALNVPFLDARVVSLEHIKTLPGSTTQILIAPKSIITPSAKDEIKKRKIEIAAKISAAECCSRLFFGFVRVLPSQLFSVLQKKFVIKPQNFADISALLNGIEKKTKEGHFAVVFSEQSATVLRMACQRNLRAVPAFDVVQTREDVKEIGADVLVVNPKRLNEEKIIEMVKTCE